MKSPLIAVIIALVGFDVVWLVAALGAAEGGMNWPGVAAISIYLIALAAAGLIGRQGAIVLIGWACAGLLAEAAFVAAGVLSYQPSTMLVLGVPPWIVGLWVSLGACFIVFGLETPPSALILLVFAAAAPLAYLAGQKIGALAMAPLSPQVWLLISLGYSLALLVLTRFPLFALRRRLNSHV